MVQTNVTQTNVTRSGDGQIRSSGLAAVLWATTMLAAIVPPASAVAQGAQAAVTEARAFDIPSQPLADALIAFGRQAGFQATADAGLVAGKQSAPVRGEMTWQQALGTLLSGTELSYRLHGSMVSLVAKPPATADDGAIRLGPVRVAGEASERAYDAGPSVVRGNRLGQTLLETPRSVSVVTRSMLDDQQPDNEVDILRNVSGVSRVNDYQGTYERFNLRGILADNGYSYLRDGYRILHQTDPALYNIERVEVIKGPNAIDVGQSTPGGFVNYVTKKPLEQEQYILELTAGSFDQYQGSIDLTGPLNADKTLLYRLTAGYESGGAYTDNIEPLRRGVSGAISWAVTPQTVLNLTAEYQRIDRLANPGWPVPEPFRLESADALPDDAFYGELTADFVIEEVRYTAELVHDFADDWQLRARFGQEDFKRDTNFISLRGLTDDGTETNRSLFQRLDSEWETITARTDLRGRVTTGGIDHSIVVGADFYRFGATVPPFEVITLPPLPVFNPPLLATEIPVVPGEFSDSVNKDYGFFIQDSIDFGGGFGLQVGVRHDILENDATNEDFSQTSPNAAVTYAPTENALLYFSFASSFEPNWNVDLLDGGVADPSEGEQFEIGFKRGWLDGRLTTTAALFALTKSNIVVNDPENLGFDSLTGEVEVKGVELEAAGELLPGLNVLAQVTALDPEISEDTDAAIVGNNLSGSVQNTASLWATYQLPGTLEGWSVGGGVYYTGERVLNDSNTLSLPSYTTVDAFVGYRLTNAISVQLNITNIADERYYVNVGTSGDTFRSTFPGEPRAISFTLRAPF